MRWLVGSYLLSFVPSFVRSFVRSLVYSLSVSSLDVRHWLVGRFVRGFCVFVFVVIRQFIGSLWVPFLPPPPLRRHPLVRWFVSSSPSSSFCPVLTLRRCRRCRRCRLVVVDLIGSSVAVHSRLLRCYVGESNWNPRRFDPTFSIGFWYALRSVALCVLCLLQSRAYTQSYCVRVAVHFENVRRTPVVEELCLAELSLLRHVEPTPRSCATGVHCAHSVGWILECLHPRKLPRSLRVVCRRPRLLLRRVLPGKRRLL